MTFQDPAYLLLLLPVAVVTLLLLRRSGPRPLPFSATALLPRRGGATWRAVVARLLPLFFGAALALLTLALARPCTVLQGTWRSADARAIELVVDISGSMEARDLGVPAETGTASKTRLEVAKAILADFVRARPDDLIGLVAFGGTAATRCPLTADHAALLHLLAAVAIPRTSAGGAPPPREALLTALGDALATACARLERSEPATRIAVLVTDGVSNTGEVAPDEAAEIARHLGIRVYTIGVGAGSEYDAALLQRVADRSGGRAFAAADAGAFAQAVDAIDRLETTRVRTRVFSNRSERYNRFLLPGLGILLLTFTASTTLIRRTI
jgi:Ca-activated chloride channel family protein